MFQQRKNKRFNYIPRRLRDETQEEDLKTQWESVRRDGKHKSKGRLSLPILVLILGMIIVLWYILTQYETT